MSLKSETKHKFPHDVLFVFQMTTESVSYRLSVFANDCIVVLLSAVIDNNGLVTSQSEVRSCQLITITLKLPEDGFMTL